MANSAAARIAVVTDSAACIPPELVREYGIHIVPYQLIWDGQVYLDGRDLTPAEFYQRFRSSKTYPTTATPTLGQFVETYHQAAQAAKAIVAIFVSSTLTSTVNVAQRAAQEAPVPVHIVDSRTAATAQAFIVLAAARAAHRGEPLEQIIAAAEACRERVGMFFAIETLEHLHRGGRIGQAASLLGARLRLQPVVTLSEGVVRPVAVARSRHRALERVFEETRNAVGGAPVRASVLHADVPDEAHELAERIRRELNCVEFFLSEFTPVMGAHTGPGVIGITYCFETGT